MENSNIGCVVPVLNVTDLVDYDITSCVVPFIPGRWNFETMFWVHPRRLRALWTFIIFTNIACYEPFTLVAVESSGCEWSYHDNKQLKQCSLVNEIPFADGLNQCMFSCVSHGTGSILIVRHSFLPWQKKNPTSYRVCEINIYP